MLTNEAYQKLHRLADYLKLNKDNLVIDGDTHPTDIDMLDGEILDKFVASKNYYQGRPITPEEVLKSMDYNGIDMSLTWQNPAAFDYVDDKERNFNLLLRANKDISAFANKYPTRFIPAGWTDPEGLGLEGALKLVDICVEELGFSIVKMNPSQNGFFIDSENVIKVVEKIVSLGAIPAFHFGGDSPYTPAKGFKKIAEIIEPHPILGVHMGGGGSHYVDGDEVYLGAREIGLECSNIFYILSAKRDCHIETDLILYTKKGAPYVHNINWGSDLPYGLQNWNLWGFKGLLSALASNQSSFGGLNKEVSSLFTPKVINGFLGGNLANLVYMACLRILNQNK